VVYHLFYVEYQRVFVCLVAQITYGVPYDPPSVATVVRRQVANVLKNHVRGPFDLRDAADREKEIAPVVTKTKPMARLREGLAGESGTKHIKVWDGFQIDRENVCGRGQIVVAFV
jgi:hypothetical protein